MYVLELWVGGIGFLVMISFPDDLPGPRAIPVFTKIELFTRKQVLFGSGYRQIRQCR